MTRQKIVFGLGIIIGLGVLIVLWKSPMSVLDVLTQPVQVLMGSPRQLETGILEVSENMTPVEEATRRLLQPLGVVRVIRRFPAPSSSDNASNNP